VTAISPSVPGLYVGTSGWSYPSWRPGFYPAGLKPGEFLAHYATRFSAVELNTTGYRIPAEDQFKRWADQVPSGFRFTPKLNAYKSTDVSTFEDRVRLLGDRLGPIRVLVGYARDEGQLALMLGSLAQELQLAFDFRHGSWEGVETELPPNATTINDLDSGATFRYLRLRDPPYDDSALRKWAERIRPLLADGTEVYVFFKHEDEPSAPRYAERLLDLIRS
jgi:uncharacterized protein YecE (DUF72 family)